jgi:hypothetical protein
MPREGEGGKGGAGGVETEQSIIARKRDYYTRKKTI